MNQKLAAIAVAGVLLVPAAAHAVTFKVGGHVSRAILFADDGIDSDVSNVDNDNSGTRFAFEGSEQLGIGNMKVGMTMELGTQSNLASSFTIKGENGTGGANDSALNIRHSYVWFEGNWGRLNLGHTSSATDGVTEADLSGLVVLSGLASASVSTYGGAIGFRTTGGGATGVTIGAASGAFDGGREDVIRYDTPKFGTDAGHIKASVAMGDNNMHDIGATAIGSLAGMKVELRGGYQNDEHSSGTDQWGVSGSVLFSQGTNITLQYSERDIRGRTPAGFGAVLRDARNFYAKLGHRWGNNSVAVDFSQTDDLAAQNDEYTSWGIGFAHQIPGPRVQLHASYRNHELDRPGANIEDIDIFGVGARILF